MSTNSGLKNTKLPRGVMLNAYPDSIGSRLEDTIAVLKEPELHGAFSLFYILPTFFHSDLDRGFSIIDYDYNEELVDPGDLLELDKLGIRIKLDLVLNHLSVRSPQFQDLLLKGDESRYKDFFIDWDKFWKGEGVRGPDGVTAPKPEHLEKLFMRKPELPTLRVSFPDGKVKTYWNTFYQKIDFDEITVEDFKDIQGLESSTVSSLVDHVKIVIRDKDCLELYDLEQFAEREGVQHLAGELIRVICSKRDYLGQMDLNARSELVWEFYDETLGKLRDYGARIVRLDAFAYLHKAPGEPNFFNRPGTWEYLQRLKNIAGQYDLTIFPEIHAEYGAGIHREIGREGYPIYDFFFPGLVIDALERGTSEALTRWIDEILSEGLETINMLGSHDGIPVLDLKGKQVDGTYRAGLLTDEQIDAVVERIIERGGMTKNLYNASGKKIDYYQVNATFYSALGEDDRKMLLARAIQMFMPGVPQVWYLDLFVGKNDYAAAGRGDPGKHKEINRTNLSLIDVEEKLQRPVVRDQVELLRLRNNSMAFAGEIQLVESPSHELHIAWRHPTASATLQADLRNHSFTVRVSSSEGESVFMSRD